MKQHTDTKKCESDFKLHSTGQEVLTKPPTEAGTWTSARYCLAYLAFFGFANLYAQRVVLSVAILSMVNSTYQKADDQTIKNQSISSCPQNIVPNSSTKNGEFNWSETQEGIILGSFFYGYIVSQLPGGYLAGRYGAKLVYGIGMLLSSILTLLTPVAARSSYELLIAVRIIEGLVQGVSFPSMHSMWGRWAPPVERSFLISLNYAGSQFGTVISQPISGILCSTDFLGGWPSVFYLFGSLGVIWCAFWFILAQSSPEDHPRISKAELNFILSTNPQKTVNDKVPWKDILLSRPVWVLAAAYVANNWGFYMLLTCLPTFLKDILHYDLSQSGFIAALPYLVMWIFINVFGFIADYIRRNGYLTTTQTRKLFNTIGQVGAGVFLILSGYVGCNQTLVIMMLCFALGVNAAIYGGFQVNGVDLSPRYSGILMGITNTLGSVPGFVAPLAVGALTENNNTLEQWRIIFFISAAIYTTGAVLFLIFGTGEEQRWNRPKSDDGEPIVSKF